jgi:hypothetical protein
MSQQMASSIRGLSRRVAISMTITILSNTKALATKSNASAD